MQDGNLSAPIISNMKVFEKANAKINLYLDVSEKREDGFHAVTTFMHQITLCDDLWIEAQDSEQTEIQLTVKGNDRIPTDGNNLVAKAIQLFLKTVRRTMKVRVTLVKRIPTMAGLGGGSSDAAAALRGMNQLLGRPLKDEKLEELSAIIGSDVPFFIRHISALCSGRGEILQKITPVMTAYAVVVEGKESSSTREAFAKLDRQKRPPKMHPDFRYFTYADAYNIFESVIAQDCPSVDTHLRLLRKHNPLCTQMSGSGSAVFALFSSLEEAHAAAKSLQFMHSKAYVCQLAQE